MIAKYNGQYFRISLVKKPTRIWRYDYVEGFDRRIKEDIEIYERFLDISELDEIFEAGFSVKWNGEWCAASPTRSGREIGLKVGHQMEQFAIEHNFDALEHDRGTVELWGLLVDIDSCEEFQYNKTTYPIEYFIQKDRSGVFCESITLTKTEWLQTYKQLKVELFPGRQAEY